MEVFVDRWGMVHSSAAAAVQAEDRQIKPSSSHARRSPRPDWVRCPQCFENVHEGKLLDHLSAYHGMNVAKTQGGNGSRPSNGGQQRQAVKPSSSHRQKRVSPMILGPVALPGTRSDMLRCGRCSSPVRMKNLSRHQRKMHGLDTGHDTSSSVGKAPQRGAARSPASRPGFGNLMGRSATRSASPIALGTVIPVQAGKASAKATQGPLGQRSGHGVQLNNGKTLRCPTCNQFDAVTAPALRSHRVTCKPIRGKSNVQPKARSRPDLTMCEVCRCPIRPDRLEDHKARLHRSHISPPVPRRKADVRPAQTARGSLDSVVDEIDADEGEGEEYVNDPWAQGRRHPSDASPDGRDFRDHGQFGSYPSHDGYGDEHWG